MQAKDDEVPQSPCGEEAPIATGSVLAQNSALNAVRDTGQILAGAELLKTTEPLAELLSAEKKGVLDEARRILIAKKGSGVVFEAATIVQLQDANERYGLQLTARLAATTNSPRADIFITHAGVAIELQLKVGEQKYIRAAIRA